MNRSDYESCPHCSDPWDSHTPRCDCGCMWPDPREIPEPPIPEIPDSPGYLYEGTIDAGILYEAFWTAAKTLGEDGSVHPMDQPYLDQKMDMIDCSGCGMPWQFWEHMAKALASC